MGIPMQGSLITLLPPYILMVKYGTVRRSLADGVMEYKRVSEVDLEWILPFSHFFPPLGSRC